MMTIEKVQAEVRKQAARIHERIAVELVGSEDKSRIVVKYEVGPTKGEYVLPTHGHYDWATIGDINHFISGLAALVVLIG